MELLQLYQVALVVILMYCYSSRTQGIPGAIDHANDVSARLVSLNSANITWRVPNDNSASITSYTLILCALFLPIDTSCSYGISVNISVPVGGHDLTMVGRNQLRYTFHELLTEKAYEVVIRAENAVGQQMSPAFGNGLRFNSSFPDDGRVVNVGFIPTTSVIIVTWKLPPLALATASLNVSFNIMYFSAGNLANTMSVTVGYNPLWLEQGSSVNIGVPDSASHTFQITAWYYNPNLLSSQATLTGVQTLANDAPLLTGPQAVVNNSVGPNDVLTISWPAPENTNFLVAYRVSFSTSSARRRRQASTIEVPAGINNTTLPFIAFTDYAVDVDAVYAPPPDRNRVFVNLLPSTTFTTPQRRSSPPLNIVAINETVVKIHLSWDAPSNPRGIIVAYRILVNDTFVIRVEGVRMYISQELIPDTNYVFQIAAVNDFGIGEFSPVMTWKTSFGVVQPVIISMATGMSQDGTPLFTIITDRFSDRYGGLGDYKVVVLRNSSVNPTAIPDAHLMAWGDSNPFNYYVAIAGDAHQQLRTTFIIGDNTMTNDSNGTVFTNPLLQTGVKYYIFIRLYSSIDPTVFSDSDLTGALALISPAIVTQPESINGAIKNSTVNFTVIASGQPLNYQWYMVVDGPDVPISRATQATLTFEGVTEENEGMYFCFISNLAGNITTATISLSILVAPTIVTQPESIDGALQNSRVSFTVVASGEPLNYQWYMAVSGSDSMPISGATQAILTFESVTMEDEGMYFCFISNRAENVTTITVSLAVLVVPTIVTQPESINGAFPNSRVSFTVVASGKPLNYQWYMAVSGSTAMLISGATQAIFTFNGVTVEDEGMYFCFISNRGGNITTVTVSLTIFQPVISSTDVETSSAGTTLFIIITKQFSTYYNGGVGIYKVVLVRGSPIDPTSIPDANLLPQFLSTFIYYVPIVGNATSQQPPTTFVIGNNIFSTDGTTIFTNPPPEAGVNYYAFIRFYSSLNISWFVDTQLTDVLRFEVTVGICAPQSNLAAILGPVVSFTIIMAALVILLATALFCVLRKQCRYKATPSDLTYGADARGDRENAIEGNTDFMSVAAGSSESHIVKPNEYEIPHLAMSQQPGQENEEIEQPPVAEPKSDGNKSS